MSRLFNTVLDDSAEIGITERTLGSSCEATKSPIFGMSSLESLAFLLSYLPEDLRSHVIERLDFGRIALDEVLHPVGIGSAESCMPMVKYRELDGDNVSGASFDSVPSQLDLTAQVEGPFRIGTWGVQDCRYVVSQDN